MEINEYLVSDLLNVVAIVMLDAEVSYPSVREAGPMISYNIDDLGSQIRAVLRDTTVLALTAFKPYVAQGGTVEEELARAHAFYASQVFATAPAVWIPHGSYKLGTPVAKIKGSQWHGRVVGYYSTTLTPIGYCIESSREPGSVQLYPETALEIDNDPQ